MPAVGRCCSPMLGSCCWSRTCCAQSPYPGAGARSSRQPRRSGESVAVACESLQLLLLVVGQHMLSCTAAAVVTPLPIDEVSSRQQQRLHTSRACSVPRDMFASCVKTRHGRATTPAFACMFARLVWCMPSCLTLVVGHSWLPGGWEPWNRTYTLSVFSAHAFPVCV